MATVPDQFFLFGDSITQQSGLGFAAPLQDEYIRRLDVVNRGFSGYNTKMALKVLSSIVPSPDHARIRFLFIFFGANDASLPGAPNKQHVPLDAYKNNLETIIKHPLVVAHSPRIILVAPPPINEHSIAVANPGELARVAATTKSYADAVCEVGEKLCVPVVNLWTVFMARTGWKADAWKTGDPLVGSLSVEQHEAFVELLSDGLHFTPSGYDILLRETIKAISVNWPDQLPENLPMVFPAWNDPPAWETFEASVSEI